MRRILRASGCLLLCLTAIAVDARDGGIVRVGGDVVVHEGRRVREAVAVGGDLTVNGEVELDAVAVGGDLILGPGASVGGSAVSVGGKVLGAERARIGGDLVEVSIPGIAAAVSALAGANWLAVMAGAKVVSLIGLAAVALLLVTVFPGPFAAVSDAVNGEPVNAALYGLLGVVLIVPVAIVLAISVVGILLIPLELLLVACACIVGYVAVARVVGRKIVEAFHKPGLHPVVQTLIGLAALALVTLVPFVGWAVKMTAGLIGFGAVMVAIRDARAARKAAV